MTGVLPATPTLVLGALFALSSALFAQTPSSVPLSRPPSPWINRSLVFLDPAHGGDDRGAELASHVPESDATLALALSLRTLLASANITVLLAREPAPPPSSPAPAPAIPPPPTPDQRAGSANHTHPFACLLLHATAAGSGVHVVTSPLAADDLADTSPSTPIPWATAQAAWISESDHLATDLVTAFSRAGLPVHRMRSSVRPIDSLICPAVAVELAPVNGTSPANPGYQQRVAEALSTALQFWRGQLDAARSAAQPAPENAP